MTRLSSYGVLDQKRVFEEADRVAELVARQGFAIVDSGYTELEIRQIGSAFDEVRMDYIREFGEARLKEVDEFNTVRMPLIYNPGVFVPLAVNSVVLKVVSMLIKGKFILNQQNGILNPSREKYNQLYWHRDIPYQHFVCSKPLSITALFCIDPFSSDNGASFVLPNSHMFERFPSDDYIKGHEVQISAEAGNFLVMDSMLYHRGGENVSNKPRRAVNHVFTIPYFKQQINLSSAVNAEGLDSSVAEFLGVGQGEPNSVKEFLARR